MTKEPTETPWCYGITPASTAPEATISPVASPIWKAPELAYVPEVGYWFSNLSQFHYKDNSTFDACAGANEGCLDRVQVESGNATEGVTVTGKGGDVRLKGSSLAELRQAWADLMGNATFTDVTIDGEAGFLAQSTESTRDGIEPRTAVAVHAGRLFVISIEAASTDPVPLDDSFLSAFHFMTPECWLQPCTPSIGAWVDPSPILRFDPASLSGSWKVMSSTWGNLPGPTDGSVVSLAPTDGIVLTPVGVGLSTGTLRTGAVVRARMDSFGTWAYDRISGDTLDALAQSWNGIYGTSTSTPAEVDGGRAVTLTGPRNVAADHIPRTPMAVVFIVRDRIVVLFGGSNVLPGFDGISLGPVEVLRSALRLLP